MTLTIPKVAWAAMATAILAVALTIAQPSTRPVDVPILGDIADTVSVAVAQAHGVTTCTTTYVTRYYYGRAYAHPKRTCTTSYTNHVHSSDVAKAVGYGVGGVLAALACGHLCGGLVAGVAILDAVTPDDRAKAPLARCNPAQTGLLGCPGR